VSETPAWEHIDVTRRDDIVELRFHTGGDSLVWDADAHREITEAFHWLAMVRDVKVVLITGTGDTYCAELDVASFAGVPWADIWWEGKRMLEGINNLNIPIIAGVNGPATVHSEIPVMADLVVAAEHTVFADRCHFATRGTVPGDGVNLVWAELLGPTRAKYFLLLGTTIDAAEALRLGVVNEVVPAGDLHSRVWALARELAARELPVLRYAKAAVSVGFRQNFSENLSHSLGIEGAAHWSRGGIRPTRIEGS
jgi:enoyl-CoA hydratase/carnithine racemase